MNRTRSKPKTCPTSFQDDKKSFGRESLRIADDLRTQVIITCARKSITERKCFFRKKLLPSFFIIGAEFNQSSAEKNLLIRRILCDSMS